MVYSRQLGIKSFRHNMLKRMAKMIPELRSNSLSSKHLAACNSICGCMKETFVSMERGCSLGNLAWHFLLHFHWSGATPILPRASCRKHAFEKASPKNTLDIRNLVLKQRKRLGFWSLDEVSHQQGIQWEGLFFAGVPVASLGLDW